ncbi:hypothetical protein D3C79_967460 [compost metagenome]
MEFQAVIAICGICRQLGVGDNPYHGRHIGYPDTGIIIGKVHRKAAITHRDRLRHTGGNADNSGRAVEADRDGSQRLLVAIANVVVVVHILASDQLDTGTATADSSEQGGSTVNIVMCLKGMGLVGYRAV